MASRTLRIGSRGKFISTTMAGMPDDALLVRARALWTAAACGTAAFGPPGSVSVVVAPQSRLCPPSWVGIVVLGQAAIVTAPTDPVAQLLHHVLVDPTPQAITDVDHLTAVLPVTEALGPATLSYLDAAAFRPAPDSTGVEELLMSQNDLKALLAAAGEADAGESGLADITSPAFIHRHHGMITAAAGYRLWPRRRRSPRRVDRATIARPRTCPRRGLCR
jgi:hypothetical protein